MAGCTSCARGDELVTMLSQSVDTTVQHQVAARLAARRVKFTGPVTIQVGGTGNVATTTNATKAKAPVAAAPHATATQTSPAAGTSWQVYIGGVVVLLVLGTWFGHKLL